MVDPEVNLGYSNPQSAMIGEVMILNLNLNLRIKQEILVFKIRAKKFNKN